MKSISNPPIHLENDFIMSASTEKGFSAGLTIAEFLAKYPPLKCDRTGITLEQCSCDDCLEDDESTLDGVLSHLEYDDE